MTLGENIQKFRQKQNLSQKELAAELGVSTGEIAEWESDETSPTIAQLAKMSVFLGVSTDQLILTSDCISGTIPTKHETPQQETFHAPVPKKKKSGKYALWITFPILVIACVIGFLITKHYSQKSFSQNPIAIATAEESVVKITCYDYYGDELSTGSGFLLYNDKTVVTNYHVLKEAYSCTISTEQDLTYTAHTILAYSEEFDLAILELDASTGLIPLQPGVSLQVKKGEPVVAIGSPLGIKNSVSTGILSGRVREDNMDVLQFTAAISSGSSGGALFNDSGNVIGVTYASYIDGQNMNLAIPIEKVTELYNSGTSPITIIKHHDLYYEYMKYIREYKNAIPVTFSELKSSPQLYNGKTVILSMYIWGRSLFSDGRIRDDMYLSETADINGDTGAFSSFEQSSHLQLSNSNLKHLPIFLENGEYVCVIGEFKYSPAGSWFIENRRFEHESSGRIEAHLIFRTDAT